MRRAPLALAVALLGLGATRAEALDLPLLRLGIEAGYADNVTGLAQPNPAVYAQGNQGYRVGLDVGLLEFIGLDPASDLLFAGDLSRQQYWPYDFFSQFTGSAFAEAHHALGGAGDAYAAYAYANYLGRSQGHSVTVTWSHEVLVVGAVDLTGGFSWYASNSAFDNQGPVAAAAFRWRTPGPQLAVGASFNRVDFPALTRTDMDYGLEFRVTQQIWGTTYARALLRHDFGTSTDPTRSLEGNQAVLGTDLYF